MFYNNGYNQDWSTLKKLVWLRGNPATGQIGTDLTVSGAPPLSLPNSLGKPLKAWEVDVLPYQEGTGDPSPSNVRPIHGTDKLTITTAGKNLCDALNDIVITNAGNIGNQPCAIPAGTYTYSATSSNTAAYQLTVFDANNVLIVSISSPRSYQGRSSLSFTITRNAAYIRCYYNASTIVSDIQVEAGATASDYTPYLAPSQTVLTLPQTVYTGTIGSDGGESRWGIYQPTASEMFWSSSSKASFYIPSWVDTSTMRGNAICSHFARFVGGWVEMPVNNFQAHVDRVGINIENVSDTAGVQAYVQAQIDAGTPIQFLFELATPTAFAVPSVTIPTPTGSATTWATAEDGTVDEMEVTYVGKA